jgi:hypothetical protein
LQFAQYRDFSEQLDTLARDNANGFSPRFLAATEDPGILHIRIERAGLEFAAARTRQPAA